MNTKHIDVTAWDRLMGMTAHDIAAAREGNAMRQLNTMRPDWRRRFGDFVPVPVNLRPVVRLGQIAGAT